VIDVRDVVFPMTAGDLVVSACIVRLRDRGMGAEVETSLLEVLNVDASPIGDSEQLLELTVRDQQTGARHRCS
jgi:hypothetical protein